MKNVLCVLVILLLAGPPALAEQAPGGDLETAARISQAEFKKLLDVNRVMVIDVRDIGAYRSGHIPGAVSVPLDTLERRAADLRASTKPIVAYCA